MNEPGGDSGPVIPASQRHRRILVLDLHPYRTPYLPGATLDVNELATGDASFGESWFGGRGVKPCAYLCHPGLVYDPYDDAAYYEVNRAEHPLIRRPARALTQWLRRSGVVGSRATPRPVIYAPLPRTGDERLRRFMNEIRLQLGVISGCKVSNDWRIRLMRRTALGVVPDTVIFPARLKDVGAIEQLAKDCSVYTEQFHGHSEPWPCHAGVTVMPFVSVDISLLPPIVIKNQQDGGGVKLRSGASLRRVDEWLEARRMWLDNRQAVPVTECCSLWHWLVWNLPTDLSPSAPHETNPPIEVPFLSAFSPDGDFDTNSHAETYGPWLRSVLDANTPGHSLAASEADPWDEGYRTGTLATGGAEEPTTSIAGCLTQYLQLRSAEGQKVTSEDGCDFVDWGIRPMPPAHHLILLKFSSVRRAVAFWQRALTLRTSGSILWGASATLVNAVLRDSSGASLLESAHRWFAMCFTGLGDPPGHHPSERGWLNQRHDEGAVVTLLVEGNDRQEVDFRLGAVLDVAREFGGEPAADVEAFYRRTRNLMFKDIFWSQGWRVEEFETPAITVLDNAFPAIKTLLEPASQSAGTSKSSATEVHPTAPSPLQLPRCVIPRGSSSNVTIVYLDCLTMLPPHAADGS